MSLANRWEIQVGDEVFTITNEEMKELKSAIDSGDKYIELKGNLYRSMLFKKATALKPVVKFNEINKDVTVKLSDGTTITIGSLLKREAEVNERDAQLARDVADRKPITSKEVFRIIKEDMSRSKTFKMNDLDARSKDKIKDLMGLLIYNRTESDDVYRRRLFLDGYYRGRIEWILRGFMVDESTIFEHAEKLFSSD